MPSEVVAAAAETKLALYQGHMRFPSKPLSPASSSTWVLLTDCSATLTRAGVVEKPSWEMRPAEVASSSRQPA